jgi:hypothetical protein
MVSIPDSYLGRNNFLQLFVMMLQTSKSICFKVSQLITKSTVSSWYDVDQQFYIFLNFFTVECRGRRLGVVCASDGNIHKSWSYCWYVRCWPGKTGAGTGNVVYFFWLHVWRKRCLISLKADLWFFFVIVLWTCWISLTAMLSNSAPIRASIFFHNLAYVDIF